MKKRVILFLIVFTLPLISAAVVINEFELNPPGADPGNEWVELYNTGSPVNLTGWYITDRDGNKFFTQNITIIDFFVLENLTGLTNNNENISLFNSTNSLQDITGNHSDSSPVAGDNRTWARVPDGTGNFTFQDGTKNATNGVGPDTTKPSVSLLLPLNGSTTTANVTFFQASFIDDTNVSNATLNIWNSSNNLIGINFMALGNDSIIANLSFNLPYTGIFFWNYLAVDSSGNQAFNNSNFTLIFNQNQTNLTIGIEIKNKSTDNSCVLSTENITLKAEVISSCIQNVIFSVLIKGTWRNFTGTNPDPISNISSFIINNSLFSGSEFVNWTVFAISCSNQTIQDGMEQFYVNTRTSLSVNPSSPDGVPPWYISEPEFTLSNPDATKIFYRWDSTGTLNYTSPFKLENAPNNGNITAGVLELTYWSNFSTTNTSICLEPEQSHIFKTDFTNPVITNLQPPANSTVFNNLRPTIEALLDEVYQSNSGIDKLSVIMLLDNMPVSRNVVDADTIDAIATHNPASNLTLGKHNVTINVSDNAGRNSQLTWMFEINISTIFNFTVYSPENKNYSTRRIPFNITATKKLEKLEYINYNERNPKFRILCRECDELGFSRRREITLLEDTNNLSFKFTDKFGTIKEHNVILFIDSEPPKISQTNPRKNIVTNGSDFMVKYSEDNLKEILLFWNPNVTLANCTSGKNQICSANINLSDFNNQFIDYQFRLSDGINTVESKAVRVKVDTTSPNLTIYSPANVSYNKTKIPFNITISEKVLLEFFDKSEFSPRWRRLCSNCNEYGFTKIKTKTFKLGNHDLLIRAGDDAGNSDIEEISFIII